MLYTCTLIFFYTVLIVCCINAIISSQKQVEDNSKELKDYVERRYNENNRFNK